MSTIYVQKEGQKWGPFTTEELEGKVEEGVFSPEDLFWTEGMDAWQPLGEALSGEPREDGTEIDQPAAEDPGWLGREEEGFLFEAEGVRLTADTLFFGDEEIPIRSVAKATAQTENISRTRPIVGSVVVGVVIVCVALIDISRPSMTHWMIWGGILLALFLWWLRLFTVAIRPAVTMVIVDLRNGDERLRKMEPSDARELATAIDQAVIAALDQDNP